MQEDQKDEPPPPPPPPRHSILLQLGWRYRVRVLEDDRPHADALFAQGPVVPGFEFVFRVDSKWSTTNASRTMDSDGMVSFESAMRWGATVSPTELAPSQKWKLAVSDKSKETAKEEDKVYTDEILVTCVGGAPECYHACRAYIVPANNERGDVIVLFRDE